MNPSSVFVPAAFAISAAALCFAATSAFAGPPPISAAFNQPDFDRWVYPFNATPGTRDVVSTFGETGGNPAFDNRDGQVLATFLTSAQVPPGLDPTRYEITNATLFLQVANDLNFIYDDTQDAWTSFIDPADPLFVPDSDPGQPVELFGAGFRNGFNAFAFGETGPFSFEDPTLPGVRNAYALGFDSLGLPIDVSNSVDQQFDPDPWAIGTIDDPAISTGDFVPVDTVMTFEINVANPDIQAYLQGSLSDGAVALIATSLTVVEPMSGSFPAFYTKENPLVQDIPGIDAARLELDVVIYDAADLTRDGVVNADDLFILLGDWGPCAGCPADLNGDDIVDADDLFILLGAWG